MESIIKQLEKLRSKKNDKLSLAIRKELNRMVKKTGYSEEEIIQKVASGEIIVENESLRYWIKTLVAQAETGKPALVLKETLQGKPPVYDKAGNLIEERIVGRPKQTRDELQTTMQESLGRGTSKKDLLKAFQQTDDEFRAIETAAYNKILKKKVMNKWITRLKKVLISLIQQSYIQYLLWQKPKEELKSILGLGFKRIQTEKKLFSLQKLQAEAQ